MDPKFPHVNVQLSASDGNAFVIIGAVRRAMKRGGASSEDCAAFSEQAMSGDYDNVLRTCMEWVNVT
jgi:hypothetical protein